MISDDLLRGIDFSFLIIVLLFAVSTPKTSKYNKINWLIVAVFCVDIGVAEAQLVMDQGRTVTSIFLNSFIAFSFAYWFWPKRFSCDFSHHVAEYISFLCASMGVFYVADFYYGFSEFSYVVVMVCFQVLLLMAASWGVVDGNDNRVNSWFRACVSWLNDSFRGHGGLK